MRKVLFMLGLLICLSPVSVWAHTDLETAKPAQNEVVNEEVKEIELTFHTEIEPTGTLRIQKEDGTEFSPQVDVSGNTMTGTLKEPLPNGRYTLKWKIIGADGHPVEGEYSFEVKAPKQEEPASDEPTTPDRSKGGEGDAEPSTSPEQPDQNAGNSPLLYVVIALLLIGALAGFGWLLRKKR